MSCIRGLCAGLRHRRDRSLPFSHEADRPKTEAALAASADQIGRARRLFPDPERFLWNACVGGEKQGKTRKRGEPKLAPFLVSSESLEHFIVAGAAAAGQRGVVGIAVRRTTRNHGEGMQPVLANGNLARFGRANGGGVVRPGGRS